MNEIRGVVTDPSALIEIVEAFGGRVLHLSRRFAASEADAEDITQEVFVALARQLSDQNTASAFRGESSLATYIYRIALNLGMKHREKMRSHAQKDLTLAENAPWMIAPSVDPEHYAEKRELAERVDAALSHLSEDQREAVLLHTLHGLTYIECAEILGVPEGTVKSRVFHGCKELRRRLDSYVNANADSYPRLATNSVATPLYQQGGNVL
jgi:RNA polymerase sigma-70 factor, ECF subfamily